MNLETVTYYRLSKEDGDDMVSTSIVNQRSVVQEYAKTHSIHIDREYVDDGYSGYTMDRPEFNKLKQDLNNNKIGTIIVKDLSRLGRHSAHVQLFLENMQNEGKRVIAISDNYDTLDENAQDIVGIQTWVNEKYIRDGSKKVRKAIDAMQKEGRYISCVPYGYYIDPFQKGVYHVDETVSMYVKEMFDMYLNGMGVNKIATEFTKRQVPTGSMATKQRLERLGKTYRGKASTKWAPNVILDMLKNDFYIGTLTLGKSKRRAINGKKIKQPPEKHYVFEDAHEPIIDKKTFALVQNMILDRSTNKYRGKRIQTRPNIFTGVLYCADCGTRLTSVGNRQNTRYVCRTYNNYGTSMCASHAVNERELTEALIYFLEHCRDNLSEAINDLDHIIKSDSRSKNNDTVITLEQDIKRVESEIKILLEQKMRETMKAPSMVDMIDKMYSEMLDGKYIQLNSLQAQLQNHRKEVINETTVEADLKTALGIFNNIIDTKNITKRQLATIVDKIVVHDDGGLDIYLKGNLHELCTNYIQIKQSDKYQILRATIDYIKTTPEHIVPTKSWKYARNQGCRIGYENYFKIFSILVETECIIKNEGYNKGYKLNKPFKDLEDDFESHIIDYDSPWCSNNVVTIRIINNICAWVESQTYKKKVF